MDYSLQLAKVSKRFAKSDFQLEEVSFNVPYGSVMGFVGENGAGKTTTIGCILGTLARDSGDIKVFGRELSDQSAALRDGIGVVYDGDNFPGYLTAAQLGNIMQGVYTNWDSRLFQTYLTGFGLPQGQKIKTYSKGMTMKLAIAAALSHHPSLLLLDEATSGLDPVMRDELLDVFLDFVQDERHSILLSSHITSDLEKIADYITFIHQGKIILTAKKDDLLYRYAVLRCRESQFLALDPEDIVAYRKKDFQIDVLTADEKTILRKYKDVVIDHVSIDEIMLLLAKGERV